MYLFGSKYINRLQAMKRLKLILQHFPSMASNSRTCNSYNLQNKGKLPGYTPTGVQTTAKEEEFNQLNPHCAEEHR